jgi:WD40 repeat protein
MLSVSSHAAGPPLVAGEPVLVPDSKGGFDYLQVDESRRRLLANHTGNNTLDVFDLGSGHLIKQVRTGKAQGVAVVPEAGKYFVSVSREEVVVVIDSETLEQTGTIKLGGPGDAIAFDPKHHCLYVGHDDGPHLWVIDTRTEKLTVTVDIPEGPEWVLYDPSTDRVFQNIKRLPARHRSGHAHHPGALDDGAGPESSWPGPGSQDPSSLLRRHERQAGRPRLVYRQGPRRRRYCPWR